MKCPKCQAKNPENSRFCGKCATPLPSSEIIPYSKTETLLSPLKELTRGTTFAGRYEVIEDLGKGGMGNVYRVLDKKIEDEVALKLLKPEVSADEEMINRFRNELKIARKITHKNVCRMYDLNEEEGTQYITMEYVSGEDLKSFIKRAATLSAAKAIFIAKQISEGLAEAHRLGIVHRDLKPSNIMIDKEGNARIMDFGIARSVRTKGMTGEGVIIGTPEYMSPEQVEGKEADQIKPPSKTELSPEGHTLVHPEGISKLPEWENSIAVLPFRDFSASKDQEHFCDGMTDAIIVRLTKLNRKLKVTSLQSVMAYKYQERSLKKIGQELEVKTILEGSVQREDSRIRVSAQLINVADDSHLWSDRYDRKMESLFEVQDELSTSIAAALRVELAPDALRTLESERPRSMEAYEYYMKGMHFLKSKYIITFEEKDFQDGVKMFEKAVELDPQYTLAYYGLSWAYEHHYYVTENEGDTKKAQEYSEKAYGLNPNLVQTNAVKGYILYAYKNKYDEAFRYLKKALEIDPNSPEANFLAGVVFQYTGLYHQGLKYLSKAIELDPNYFWNPYKLGMCYLDMGEFEKSAFYFAKYFEVAPRALIYPGRYISLLIKMKAYDKAQEKINQEDQMAPGADWLNKYKALLLAVKGEKEKALSLFKNSEIYSILGMKDEAIKCLKEEIRPDVYPSYLAHPYLYYLYLSKNNFLDNIRSEPQFTEILEQEKRLYEEYLKKYGDI